MATPQAKLANSLGVLKALQDNGAVAIRSADLKRAHRERLLKTGFLQEVMKGWYIPVRPHEEQGETTAWYASFWDFCAAYLRERFGKDWASAPSNRLRSTPETAPFPRSSSSARQRAATRPTGLLYGTSIFDMRAAMPAPRTWSRSTGLRLFAPAAALIDCSPAFFTQSPTDARTVLAQFADASDVLAHLLEGGHSAIAGRLAGAFRNIGRDASPTTS